MWPMAFSLHCKRLVRTYRDVARADVETFTRERSRAAAIRRVALSELPTGSGIRTSASFQKRLLELAEDGTGGGEAPHQCSGMSTHYMKS
jgi:hypothetical protein